MYSAQDYRRIFFKYLIFFMLNPSYLFSNLILSNMFSLCICHLRIDVNIDTVY